MRSLSLDDRLRQALMEDIGRGDVTTDSIVEGGVGERQGEALIIAKEQMVLAGWNIFSRVFELLGPAQVRAEARDGELIDAGRTLGYVHATARVLLTGERVALNFLQRMCG